MKKLFPFLFVIFSFVISFAQKNGNDFPSSVFIPPQDFKSTVAANNVVTINGFDNFHIGNDNGEPYIAVNPLDPKKQVCAYNINSFYYTLNGIDWIRSYPSFGPYQQVLGDPVMAYNKEGILFYVTLYSPNLNSGPWGIAVAKSTDNGITWSNYYQAHQTTLQLADKEWVAIDQTNGPYSGNIYIGWRQYGSTGMGFIRSTDQGATWSPYAPMTGGQGAYLSVGPKGNIQGGYVYYACSNDYLASAIYMHRSSDGGASFEFLGNVVSGITTPGVIYGNHNRPTLKNTHIRCDNMPRMAVDNGYTASRGNVYIVYAMNPPGPDLADIYFVRSTDNGVSWSQPVKLNDDATTTDQWMPTIHLDNNSGTVYVNWYDSRNDPVNNILTDIYGTTSTNGGVSFTPDERISNASFNPDTMATVNLTDASYIGDYYGTASTGSTSCVTAWMDNRQNVQSAKQNFIGYYPDFAMTTNTTNKHIGNNDSAFFTIKVPGTRGIFTDRVKFNVTMDTMPSSGSIQFSFINGKDSLTSYPDSVYLRVKTIGNVTPGLYTLSVYGRGRNGTPVHRRNLSLYINASEVFVQTNRSGYASFKVNGVTYYSNQNLTFPNGTVINVQALSPVETGGLKFVFHHWSDGGDTTHNVTVNGPMTLVAYYKVQYKLVINSTIPYTFGGDQYYDSASTVQFGVTGRIINYNGQVYTFKGWDGTGNGSYTSPDSTGTDSTVSIPIPNVIVESARWFSPIYVNNISKEIPKDYKLHQNYPNPFNPVTVIKFDIIKSGNTKIIVYDAIGREIKTLVNELLSPGKYNFEFNAINLASGIYYYKIITNDFTDIKKMLLIK